MNPIIAVYLAYFWVGLIHALFVGVTLYHFFGVGLKRQHPIVPLAIIFVILVFFELYWIPMFQSLNIEILVKDKAVLQHFGITENTNIVNVLRPNWISFMFWIASTGLSYRIGNRKIK